MKFGFLWQGFRRSENVEDYSDPNKPLDPQDTTREGESINERLALQNSEIAKDAGADDVKAKPNPKQA